MRKPSRGLAAALALVVAAGVAGSMGVANATGGHGHGHGQSKPKIKNVIYLLGDGMGRTHVTAARERYYGADGKLNMEKFPAVGQVSTYAVQQASGQPGDADFAPNYVTDSASAATAWSSGVKTYNAALGVDAKGNVVPTIMEYAKLAGLRTGNVSTAEITDATPAGQMSHALLRGCQGPTYSDAACQNPALTGGANLPTTDVRVTPIADQIARNNTADVILGGGLSRFDAADESALEANGYDVLGSPTSQTVATKSDLAGASSKKVFALFNKGNMTIEKYKRENPASVQAQEPTVAEMTKKAIDLLKKGNSRGFYLQVEGALIDKRSHANDAAQTLEEMKAFDEAVKVAYDFAKKDGHTLVIVTADHECAGFNIIEKGTFTNAEATTPPANADSGNPANNSTPSRPAGGTKDPVRSSGIINGAGSGDPANFAPATFRTPDDPAGVVDGTPEASLWLTYLSGNHTGADVPVFAYGPDSDELEGSIDNTDLFGIVGGALKIVH
ncbi:MAG TPA: alkaline phosphatase [Nocardioides sp.]|uniref:alkaline phosphatase n=1 Tax=uncultured Nocardioides sp. TaxID=198441 RepID=UPI000EF09049|nr:alkaline phosphatase [uncultured Nocardioides sp.]HCB02874.1 alkaline phosphatase [Nocardioides sp.]HRD61462.1 alkaline phosphatase [Nocardioides sp.]HRI96142.1 alkaline phosphatase [Nocardioides sp.]HRK46250.1 alkaline phosphatase [Nocardioides sp.]